MQICSYDLLIGACYCAPICERAGCRNDQDVQNTLVGMQEIFLNMLSFEEDAGKSIFDDEESSLTMATFDKLGMGLYMAQAAQAAKIEEQAAEIEKLKDQHEDDLDAAYPFNLDPVLEVETTAPLLISALRDPFDTAARTSRSLTFDEAHVVHITEYSTYSRGYTFIPNGARSWTVGS